MGSTQATTDTDTSNANAGAAGAGVPVAGGDSGGGGADADVNAGASATAGGGEGAEAKNAEGGGGRESILGGDGATDKGSEAAGEQGKGADASADHGELKVELPEGMEIDKALVDGYAAKAKELGLNSEQASGQLKWYAEETAKAIEAQAEQQKQAEEQRDEAWLNEIKGNPDFGGEKLNATKTAAQRAIKAYGGDSLRDALVESGMANNPALVFAFARIGQAMGEDNTGRGGGSPAAAPTREEKINDFYRGPKK